MATLVENLLRADLSQNADYETLKHIKAGKLGAAATIVLTARRKSMFRWKLFFGAMVAVPIFLNLILVLITFQRETTNAMPGLGMGMFAILALMNVPMLIQTKASLTRLETILTLWLMGDSNSAGKEEDSLVKLLMSED